MLINFEQLIRFIGHINIKGALHIGAHDCEELDFYAKLGLGPNDICWIDALNEKVEKNKEKGISNIYQAVVTDKDDDTVEFNVSNNGQSSSIFDFGTHALYHDCYFESKRTLKTSRIDTLFKKYNWPDEKYNFWNLDIQGAELLALKGAGQCLKNVDVIYVEINTEQVYKGCPHVTEIDSYLASYGFSRILTSMWKAENWGDAVYIRLPPKISLCIPTMDRWSFLKDVLPDYINNHYVDEIIISDENGNDCDAIFRTYGAHSKIRLFSNTKRLGAFLNKQAAVSYAKNKWVCVFDSDNFAPLSYFRAAMKALNDESTVYVPSRLLPYKGTGEFDNRKFIGRTIGLSDIASFESETEILLQGGNYICAKDFFMKALPSYGLEDQCSGLDALYKSILFLKHEGKLQVVKDMEYHHAIHDGSITIQSLGPSFELNKILYKNMLFGHNPWLLSLRNWLMISKPLSQWLVNCSEFTKNNDEFVPFPIGMSWQIACVNGDFNSLTTYGPHTNLVMCSISEDTDARRRSHLPVNRKSILQNLARNGITNNCCEYVDFLLNLRNYKFVISPEGNGIDAHRTYEALMMGCIPIVEENSVIQIKYPNLPILFTKDYSEINSAYLESKWARMLDTTYDFSPLFLSYYSEDIQHEIKKNSDYWCRIIHGHGWKYYKQC